MLRIFGFIAFFSLLLTPEAAVAEAEWDDSWIICEVTADCVGIPVVCGSWRAINKKHLEEAEKTVKAWNAANVKCPAWALTPMYQWDAPKPIFCNQIGQCTWDLTQETSEK